MMQSQAPAGSVLEQEEDYTLRKARLFEGINKVISALHSELSDSDAALKDVHYTRITDWCKSNNFYTWSKTPRTLVILLIIGCPDAIEAFANEGLSDLFLPYSEENLPRVIKGSKRADFIAHQHKVLSTQAISLENPTRPHCNIDGDADVHFHLYRELGSGGFGTVDHVFSRLSLKPFARKRIPRGRSFKRDQNAIRMFENELKALKTLSHRHLVRLMGSYTDRKWVGLIITPVADMDFQAYLSKSQIDVPDRPIRLRQFFGCLATAVEYLHQQKIRHKDIKPQNILVKDGRVLLADFGTSRCWADETRDTTTGTNKQAFTKAYCAPEVANHETRNISADIWSLGCVFLEMCNVLTDQTVVEMRLFFQNHGSRGMYIRDNPVGAELWMEHLRRLSPDSHDHQVLNLVPDMCDPTHNNRPTATEIVSLILDFEGPMYYGFCCDRDQDPTEAGDHDTTTVIGLSKPISLTTITYEANSSTKSMVEQSTNSPQSELTLRPTATCDPAHDEIVPSEISRSSLQVAHTSGDLWEEKSPGQSSVEGQADEDLHNRPHSSDKQHQARDEAVTEVVHGSGNDLAFKDADLANFDLENEKGTTYTSTMAKSARSTVSSLVLTASPPTSKKISTPNYDDSIKEQESSFGSDIALPVANISEEQLTYREKTTTVSRKQVPLQEVKAVSKEPKTKFTQTQDQTKQHSALSMWFEDNKMLLEQRGQREESPLHLAAEQGRLDVVMSLVEQGAHIEAKNKYQWTALHCAAYRGHLEVVQWLVKQGADIEAKNKDQRTALHCAASTGHLAVVQWLVKQGANLNAFDLAGNTPRAIAKMEKHQEMVEWFATITTKERTAKPIEAREAKPTGEVRAKPTGKRKETPGARERIIEAIFGRKV